MSVAGPTGKFPFGQPLSPSDRGEFVSEFSCLKERNLLVMNFGSPLEWFSMTGEQAKFFITQINKQVEENFGKLSYNPAELPLAVTLDRQHGIIQVKLPESAAILAANPEMWLALAQVVGEKLKLLRN